MSEAVKRSRPWASFVGAFWPFLLGCVLVAGGFAAIAFGYFGVSGTVIVGLQVPYLVSGAVLGLALVFLGSSLILAQVLTRQSRLLRRMLAEVQPEVAPTGPGRGDSAAFVVAPGAGSFHQPGCLLVEGKPVERISAADAVGRGLTPCRLCDPVVPAGVGATASRD